VIAVATNIASAHLENTRMPAYSEDRLTKLKSEYELAARDKREAMRRLEIPKDMQKKYGFPALG
jgi:hypothetical protein